MLIEWDDRVGRVISYHNNELLLFFHSQKLAS